MKWGDFLSEQSRDYCGSLMPESDVNDLYDNLVADFCEEHEYAERTREMTFYDKWYDTFKDEFYQSLDRKGIKIIHANPSETDWDFGRKFELVKGDWQEVGDSRK